MKKIFALAILLLLIIPTGCQKDDICPESTNTTPLLIIRFYENEDPFDPQAPQNLSIKHPDSTSFVTVRGGSTQGSSEIIEYNSYSQDSLAIPLRTDQDITTLQFTINTALIPEEGEEPVEQEEPENTDTITFSYARQEEYINRACAFKVNYVGLKIELQGGEDGAWMQDIQIEQTNIDDQNNAHVSIFF